MRRAPAGPSPAVLKARRERVNEYAKQITALIEQDRLVDAYRQLVAASRIPLESRTKSKLVRLVRDLEQAAGGWVHQGDELFTQEQFNGAIEKYQAVASMRKLRIARRASQKLVEAENDPRVKQAMLEVRATNMWGQVQCVLRGQFVEEEDDSDTPLDESSGLAATTSLDEQEIEAWPGEGEFEVQIKTETPPEAEGGWPNLTALGWTNGSESTNQPLTDLDRARALSMADRVRLVSLLESLCEYYADTPAGQKAVQLHEKLSADPQFMAEITRHKDNAEAERQYQLASLYLKARKYDKAAKLCQEIIDNWPNSDWAKQARKDLEVAQSVPQLQGSRTR